MKALVKTGPHQGLELVDWPIPQPGPGEVLIRVMRTGICGTDLHIDAWDPWAAAHVNAPVVTGHEFYGEVVAKGEGVRDVAPGDRVSGEGHIVCGTCRNCRAGRRHMCVRTQGIGVQRDGCFAQFIVLPEANVWVHPASMNPDLGAIFDPLGNAVHTALAFSLVGEDVLITGAGPIGLMAAAVARHVGARYVVITDLSDTRLDLARNFGVDLALNTATTPLDEALERLGMREGFDVGLEMSGSPAALSQMIDHMTHGGRIAMLGLPSAPASVNLANVITHMLTIRGIYGREMFETWYAMAAMLQSGLIVDPVITDRFPATQWRAAFDTAAAGVRGKVVMDWTVFEGGM